MLLCSSFRGSSISLSHTLQSPKIIFIISIAFRRRPEESEAGPSNGNVPGPLFLGDSVQVKEEDEEMDERDQLFDGDSDLSDEDGPGGENGADTTINTRGIAERRVGSKPAAKKKRGRVRFSMDSGGVGLDCYYLPNSLLLFSLC